MAVKVNPFCSIKNLKIEYYMRARYYDASVGRFISEDPAGFQGGLNLYAYVGGNPMMLVDPLGLSWQSVGSNAAKGVAVGVVGGVAVGVAAVGAAAIGVPVAVVTAGLGAIAMVGIVFTSYNIGDGILKDDWDRVAYNAGSLVGGLATGAAGGRAVAKGVNGVPSGPFRLNDSAQNYKPELGSISTWLGTGPNVGSAGLSVGVGGSAASNAFGGRK